MTNIIGIDTETSGLLERKVVPLHLQPYITEICIVKFDKNFELVDCFETLFACPVVLEFWLEKKIGIYNWMLENEKPFIKYHKIIKKMIEESDLVFGQNMMFDYQIILNEFARINKKVKFPKQKFCHKKKKLISGLYCTIENSMDERGRRLKNDELYNLVTGKTLKNAHRAKNDILATAEVFKKQYFG